MVDEWCGSEGALGVGLVLQNVATVAQDPGGRLLRRSFIAYWPAMRLARVAQKK